MKVAIIGAGMSGLACAAVLAEHGLEPHLFDKSRGVGGRMATRRIETTLGTATFDHGAQFLVAHDAAFQDELRRWRLAGAAAPWPAAGADAWIGVPATNSIPKHMAEGFAISFETHVHSLARRPSGWFLQSVGRIAGPYDAVVIALPAEQAAALLGMHCLSMARVAVETPSTPCWTLMCAFTEPLPGPSILQDRGIIAWAARNNSKAGRDGPDAWTVHATADWSSQHLEEDKQAVAAILLDHFTRISGTRCPDPLVHTAHRWRFALASTSGRGALWDAALALGACGDWLVAPTIEGAWLSGRQLAREIIEGHDLGRVGTAQRRTG